MHRITFELSQQHKFENWKKRDDKWNISISREQMDSFCIKNWCKYWQPYNNTSNTGKQKPLGCCTCFWQTVPWANQSHLPSPSSAVPAESPGRSQQSPVHPICNNRTRRVLLGAASSSVKAPFRWNMQNQLGETSSHWCSSILEAPRSGKSPSESCWEERFCFVDAVDISWLVTFDFFWQTPFPLHQCGQQLSFLLETWTNLTLLCSFCYFREQFIPGSLHQLFPSSSFLHTSDGMISSEQLQAHCSPCPSFFYKSLRYSSFSCL